MKKVLLLLVIVYSSAIYSQNSKKGWMFINNNTIALDKQKHFVVGSGVSAATYTLALNINGGRRGNAKMWGIISSVVIGTLKEAVDSAPGGTGFDWSDIGYTAAGGVVGTYTFDIFTNKAKNRKRKRLN